MSTPLYNLPRGSYFKIVEDPTRVPPGAIDVNTEEVYKLHNIDGMYSYCHDSHGQICHPAAWTEVTLV